VLKSSSALELADGERTQPRQPALSEDGRRNLYAPTNNAGDWRPVRPVRFRAGEITIGDKEAHNRQVDARASGASGDAAGGFYFVGAAARLEGGLQEQEQPKSTGLPVRPRVNRNDYARVTDSGWSIYYGNLTSG